MTWRGWLGQPLKASELKLQRLPDLRQAAKGRCMSSKDDFPREKQWKNLYTRSVKLARAQQLGIEYPRTTEKQLIQGEVMSGLDERLNVLFICSRNQWRSPTAEQIWRRHPKVSARSAGTSPNARHQVSTEDISWAHVILVMEEKHKSRLKAEFTRLLNNKPVHVLDIPDDYRFMDPELVEMLEQSVNSLLGLE
jgi:predicted protein tyrosine phosphatase